MTRLGRGCFWELFDPDWGDLMHVGQKAPTRPSYCHPWSAGATPFLSKFVLGVQPLTPGFESVTVTPFVSEAWPSVGGAVPVHSGKGALSLNASFTAGAATGAATVSITLLSPVPATVGLPVSSAASCVLQSMDVDGREVTPEPRNFGPVGLPHMFTLALKPGRHVVLGHYSGCEGAPRNGALYPFLDPPVYPVTTRLDRTTQGGGWRGKYGQEAYALFGYDKASAGLSSSHLPGVCTPEMGCEPGTDRVHIPDGSFVKGFSFAKGCADKPKPTWMANASGLPKHALLADPAGASAPPSLGFASGGGDGSQGTYLDVNTTVGTRYELAMYMVGSAGDLSIQVTRIMDLQTLNPIAKGVALERYGGGTWLVLEYDRPIRVQIISIDGLSTISAAMVSSAATVSRSTKPARMAPPPTPPPIPPIWVRYINNSVPDPRGYKYRRCGEINLAALTDVDGVSIFKDQDAANTYGDTVMAMCPNGTGPHYLEMGSCRDAGFFYPARNCVANPLPWCTKNSTASAEHKNCCSETAGAASDSPVKQAPWAFTGYGGRYTQETCSDFCNCSSRGRTALEPKCTATTGECSACNMDLPFNHVRSVNIYCENVGCVHGNGCNDALYTLCGAARNQSAAACSACAVLHRQTLLEHDCKLNDDLDFCRAAPPFCNKPCRNPPPYFNQICPHCGPPYDPYGNPTCEPPRCH